MATINDNLTLLTNTKNAIKATLEAAGVTVGNISLNSYPSKVGNMVFGGGVPTPTPWVRPTDWPVLPTLVQGNQMFVGLHAVYNDSSNFCALSATVINIGSYTVDWGDGTSNNVSSGQIAYHIYDYNNVNLSAVTSRGYKCAIVRVFPNGSGDGLLTALNLHCKHNQANLGMYSSGFLDMAVAGPSLNSLLVGVQTAGSYAQTIRFADLEQFQLIGTNAITNMSNMFYNCYSLQSVPLLNTSNVTSMSNMFSYCNSLQSVPLFNTSNVTDMSFMFSGCYSLQSVPLFDTIKVTNVSNMFTNCYSLKSVPLFDTSNVTNMSYIFNGCYSLQSVPLFNTSNVTNMSAMFISCTSLQSVPLFNTSNVTNMSGMFNNCYSLQSVPLFNTSNVSNMSNMFSYCYSLQSVPLFNTGSVTDMSNMFNDCNALSNIDMSNIKVSLSVANCKLSASALDKLYGNLATVTGQTITVSGNWGIANDTPAIATAKGWTVSGS